MLIDNRKIRTINSKSKNYPETFTSGRIKSSSLIKCSNKKSVKNYLNGTVNRYLNRKDYTDLDYADSSNLISDEFFNEQKDSWRDFISTECSVFFIRRQVPPAAKTTVGTPGRNTYLYLCIYLGLVSNQRYGM